MPIKGLSEKTILPRLGKIHLGIKVNAKCSKCAWEGLADQDEDEPICPLCSTRLALKKRAYPRATKHFVVPDEIKRYVGDEPTELDIMFPLNNLEDFAPQWLRAYSQTQGLVCIGDGETCRRKVDVKTGAMADHNTPEGAWVWKEGLDCNQQDCPDFLAKRCRQVMNLMVLLPNVPGGLGVWQIDTSSFYSIRNINSMVRELTALLGRCAFIPLKLKLGPREVSPAGAKKKTVHIMYVEAQQTLTQLALTAQKSPAQVLLPEPDLGDVEETFYSGDEEEGEENQEQPEAVEPGAIAESEEPVGHAEESMGELERQLNEEAERAEAEQEEPQHATPQLFQNWGQLGEAALKLGVSPSQVIARARKKRWTDFASYAEAWKVVEELVNEKDTSPKML